MAVTDKNIKHFITVEQFREVMELPILYRNDTNEVGLPMMYRDKEKTAYGGCRLTLVWGKKVFHKTVGMEALLKYFPETYYDIKYKKLGDDEAKVTKVYGVK